MKLLEVVFFFYWVLNGLIWSVWLHSQREHSLIVLSVSLLFFFNRMGALFFITTNQCFSTVSAAELFIIERKLFVYVICQRKFRTQPADVTPTHCIYLNMILFFCDRHEYISGYYRVSVYFLAKILSDITLRTITSVIFSCTVYFLIGMTHEFVEFL